MTKPTPKTSTSKLGRILDRKSWVWLESEDREVAYAVDELVAAGESPEAISKFVAEHCSAYEGDFSELIKSAARHLTSTTEA